METSGIVFGSSKPRVSETSDAANRKKEELKAREGESSGDVLNISEDSHKMDVYAKDIENLKSLMADSPELVDKAQGNIQKWDVVRIIFDAYDLAAKQLEIIKTSIIEHANIATKAQANVTNAELLKLAK